MLDAPIDGWYAWIGLAIVSVIVLGLVLALPKSRAPDADRVADAIDAVATSEYEALKRIDVDAAAIRLDSTRLSLRHGDAVSHATLSIGRVTPVGDGRLGDVLAGRPPTRLFDSPAAFEAAMDAARERASTWRSGVARLTVRRVTWGNVSGTLVG